MPGAGERGRSPERARSGTPSKMTLSPLRGELSQPASQPAAWHRDICGICAWVDRQPLWTGLVLV
jgi:hypothetical protein